MDRLQTQITEAQAAAAKVAELEDLKAQAATLPDLLEQERKGANLQATGANLRAATDRAAQTLAGLHERVASFRARFAALASEAEALELEYGAITGAIYRAGDDLRRAAGQYDQAARESDLMTGDSFPMAWQQAGGADPALALETVPPEEYRTVAGQVFDVLSGGGLVYRPHYGAGNFRNIPGVRLRP